MLLALSTEEARVQSWQGINARQNHKWDGRNILATKLQTEAQINQLAVQSHSLNQKILEQVSPGLELYLHVAALRKLIDILPVVEPDENIRKEALEKTKPVVFGMLAKVQERLQNICLPPNSAQPTTSANVEAIDVDLMESLTELTSSN